MEFEKFPKIGRLSKTCIITEKIDGTNAQICITEDNEIYAGSRNRWITPEDDNYGFARWVYENGEELLKLGPGRHFGEWWGQGIQRRYDMDEKRFSLFNTGRWLDAYEAMKQGHENDFPKCCHVVPEIIQCTFDTQAIEAALKDLLKNTGSLASPGFLNPEGIIVYYPATRNLFKLTEDNLPKGEQ